MALYVKNIANPRNNRLYLPSTCDESGTPAQWWQPGEPASLRDAEIAPLDPQADELDRSGTQERLGKAQHMLAGESQSSEERVLSDIEAMRR